MSKSNSITAYLMRVDEQGKNYRGYLSEVENSLKAEQSFVGGHIEVISLTEEIDAIINDFGKHNGLRSNRVWKVSDSYSDVICGNIMCVRHDSEGNFTSIHEEDIKTIQEHLVPVKEIFNLAGNTVIVTLPDKHLPEWEG